MLSLAPSILVMMTSFTRIVVGLSLLRTALGTATAPPNSVVISLALFLTAFVMGPVFTRVYDTGVKPLGANEITVNEAFDRASDRCATSWRRTSATRTCSCSWTCRARLGRKSSDDVSMWVLVPALMISELKRAFEIGFLLFLPF